MAKEKYEITLDKVKKIDVILDETTPSKIKGEVNQGITYIIKTDSEIIEEGRYYNVHSLSHLLYNEIIKKYNIKMLLSDEENPHEYFGVIDTEEKIIDILKIRSINSNLIKSDIKKGEYIYEDDFLSLMNIIEIKIPETSEIENIKFNKKDKEIKMEVKRKQEQKENHIEAKEKNIITIQKESEQKEITNKKILQTAKIDEEIQTTNNSHKHEMNNRKLVNKLMDAIEEYVNKTEDKVEYYKNVTRNTKNKIKQNKSQIQKIVLLTSLATLTLIIILRTNINNKNKLETTKPQIAITDTYDNKENNPVTINDIYENIYIGDKYYIESASLSASSDGSPVSIIGENNPLASPGEYIVNMIAFVSKEEGTIILLDNEYFAKSIKDIAEEKNLNLSEYEVKVHFCDKDGGAKGWSTVDLKTFINLAKEIKEEQTSKNLRLEVKNG